MPIDRVVANASPLISLFRSGLEDLFTELWEEVAVPGAVWDEVLAGPEIDPAARSLPTASWARRVTVSSVPPQVAGWDLGPGESEVLTFALENHPYRAIIDDAEARRCARTLGIPFLGTGAVLVLAKKRGLISSVTEALEGVRTSGLWISDEIVAMLRRQADE